jgi:flagellar L-ring protein precursor FlgH
MKLKAIAIISLILLLTAGAFAQESKQEKKARKKKNQGRPELTVVKMENPPPTVAAYVPPKPANGSLFTDGAANASLLADFKAGRVGDLVFVDVVETNTANVTSSASRDRDSGTLGGITGAIAAIPGNAASTVAGVVQGLGQRKFEGNGQTQRKSNVRGRITARVVEVLPNGDMRIEALKLVKINKETEQMAVTGIVRRNDLAGDNSITTVAIGDLRVEFNGKGVASADNAPGWLFRLFDKISPF